MNRKTKLEIINETVEYYSVDPVGRRGTIGVDTRMCRYKTNNGKMCAAGRCMIDPPGEAETEYIGAFTDEVFKEEYRGHDMAFWVDLQTLHDDPEYWNEKGLTNPGKAYLEVLLSLYADK